MLAIVRPFAAKLIAMGVDPEDVIECEVGVSMNSMDTLIKVKVQPKAHVVDLVVTDLEAKKDV